MQAEVFDRNSDIVFITGEGKKVKIYLASSWKNEKLVFYAAQWLRKMGHEVDAFVDDSNGRYVFNWKEIIEDKNKLNVISFLEDRRSQRAFEEDKKWLDWCECCLLILPAGNSSHLEAGYIKGKGKILIIYSIDFVPGEFDVMYGFADLITDKPKAIENFLKMKGEKE